MRIATLAVLMWAGMVTAQEPDLPGTPVSRPLTPVTEPPANLPAPAVTVDTPDQKLEPNEVTAAFQGPLPDRWSHYDLLLTWSKAQPLPALVTDGNNLLVGGRGFGNKVQAGFRFGLGWAINAERDAGFEFDGLFLGTRVSQATFPGGALGRPYVNAITGQPATLGVSGISLGTGGTQVTTTTRVQGWEVTGLKNLVDAGDIKFNVLGGYRYFGVNEGLHVQQQSLYHATGNSPATLWGVYDQFDARNNFHGGQLGFQLDHIGCRWLVTLRTTVALGNNFETVQATGRSSATTAALPIPAVQPYGAGFLAVNSNSGRQLQSRFAVVPEARLNLGYRLSTGCHFFAGYDFFYLSSAVRPGDQVDLTVNPTQSPILGGTAGPAFVGPNRPTIPFNRTDFWVQGLTLGVDYRY